MIKLGAKLDERNTLNLKKMVFSFNQIKVRLQKDVKEYRDIQKELIFTNNASVVVEKVAHPGVVIIVADLPYRIKRDIGYVEFRKVDGYVTFRSL